MATIDTSIILSTYNAEEWLEKVLWSYTLQSKGNFETVIGHADSREATKNLIKAFRGKTEITKNLVGLCDRGFTNSETLK